MLQSLAIRDVVLIQSLRADFETGLCALTGETGAGKSILLDSLGLALGARADSALVRQGAERAQVIATFAVPMPHPARALLCEQELEEAADEEVLILRRTVSEDGRSRAYVNDVAVSVGLLRRLGGLLVEIQGQFDQRGLMDPAGHLDLLDAFADVEPELERTRAAHRSWRNARQALDRAEADLEQARAEEEALTLALEDLDKLAPEPEEERRLSQSRSLMMHGERLMEAIAVATTALAGGPDDAGGAQGASAKAGAALRGLERVAEQADGRFDPVLDSLQRATAELVDAEALLRALADEIEFDPRRQEEVEERLFALRAAARKYGVDVEALPTYRDRIAQRLASLTAGNSTVDALRAAAEEALGLYRTSAEVLSRARKAAAARLDAAITAELPPLKLEKARFVTVVEDLPERSWSAAGIDDVHFEAATNPGSKPGPLAKIASGGELSRFMLALKVVLARASTVPTLVFDEVDSGVGGATAAAVGERLARLADELQVLVVTHSPQVAARADHQWRVAKAAKGEAVATDLEPLDGAARLEEIARMLAGAEITDAARAAARSLLDRGDANGGATASANTGTRGRSPRRAASV